MATRATAVLLATLAGSGLLFAEPPATNLTSHTVGAWGIDLSDQDRAVRPGDDFYRFQNGAWLARTELGPNLPLAAYWRDLRLLAPRRIAAILDQLVAKDGASLAPAEAKAAAFYRSFLDESTIERLGPSVLAPELDAIRSASTPAAIAELMGRLEGPGAVRRLAAYAPPVGLGLFRADIGQDPGDPTHATVFLRQGGLLLPGPEYSNEPQFADIRAAYETYAARLLTAIGWPEPQARARDIVAFEARVAAASWSHEQLLDSVKTYNPLTLAELVALAPAFDWRAFMRGAELTGEERVVIDAKSAFPAIAEVFAATPLATLQARLAFALADARAPYSSRSLSEPRTVFRGQALGNNFFAATERSVAAERATEVSLSDIVGALYVARYSSSEAKAAAEDMADRLRAAFDARLARSPWLSSAGRALARAKLAKLAIHIGFPARFDDAQGLEIRAADLYGNVSRAAAHDWHRQIAQLHAPYDRSAWTLAAEYPNYSYVATTNTVEIPAALLQPPFFDLRADPAVNYGALGALVGQMIVTAFTQQGLAYDGDGRLHTWLPEADRARFAALSDRLSARYSTFEPLPGLHLKGALLVDEAVADLGGLQIAFDAYHAALAGSAAPILDGTTGEQRFFLARAQMWRAKFPDAFVRNQIATGTNAPPWVRVDGPLPQLDAWYAAFGIQAGDRSYIAPADRLVIW